jgi:hypothetical protein
MLHRTSPVGEPTRGSQEAINVCIASTNYLGCMWLPDIQCLAQQETEWHLSNVESSEVQHHYARVL